MISISIFNERKNVFSEKGKEKLVKVINEPIGRSMCRTIEISRLTNFFYNEILDIIGRDYANIVTVVPDDKLKFGKIRVIVKPCFPCNKYTDTRKTDITLIENIVDVDTTKLDEVIVMESPKYLIMSINTLTELINSSDDSDTYAQTEHRVYHSYKKIPIAISEFLAPGSIDCVLN